MKVKRQIQTGILAAALAAFLHPAATARAEEAVTRGYPEATKVVTPDLPGNGSDRYTDYANLIFRLSEKGVPKEVTVESTSNPDYAKAYVRALEEWRFEVPSGHVPGETVYRLPVVIAHEGR